MAEKEEEAAKIESFLQWAAANLGISDSPPSTIPSEHSTLPRYCLGHSLIVSNFPDAGGRGLAAARDLRKGELILRVPKKALMTSECLMRNDQTLSASIKRHAFLSSTQILTVALLNEVNKGSNSWWSNYLKQLPRSYDTLAGFGPFEIQALQVDDAIWAAEKAVAKAKLEWEEASLVMVDLKLKPTLLNFKAWLWASATISSRTMHIPWDEAGCLCPVGDFFNYAAPAEEPCDHETVGTCTNGTLVQTEGLFDASAQRLTDAGYEEDVAAYCFYASRNYREKEQIFLSYGVYTNLELLEHYGFLLNDNPNDKAFIPLEPAMRSLCSWPKELLYINQDGKPSFALLSAMRLWATPSNKRRSVGHLAYSGKQLSFENEITVIGWIAKKCQDILRNLKTSVEQDKLLLNIIDKIEDSLLPLELEKLPSICGSELYAFLESHDVANGEDFTNLYVSQKSRRSICRWKFAIQWRLSYKRKLLYCSAE
ncbi:hypothetical protein ACH5RR_013470 [Cinchona calisaya]|uniref:SET domain-containing protein n=1 Tax=Cinchona calisaya TaxID=153742 RepID=A0ABD3A1I6_9GENT